MARKGYTRYRGTDGGRFLAWREWTWSWNDKGDATFVDVDAVYACPACKQALALIELAAPGRKAVSVLRSLAVRSETPGLLVQFDVEDGEPSEAQCSWVHPAYGNIGNMESLERLLRKLRMAHVCSDLKGPPLPSLSLGEEGLSGDEET